MRISDWSSDVCSSDLLDLPNDRKLQQLAGGDVEVFFLREIGADYVGKISIEYLAENLDLVGKLSRPIDDATVTAAINTVRCAIQIVEIGAIDPGLTQTVPKFRSAHTNKRDRKKAEE